MLVQCCENEQQKDGSLNCKSGKGMYESLTHPSTKDEWIAFMQDSLVKTLALLENRQDLLKEPDRGFTEKSCVLLGLLDRDSSTWKMWPLSRPKDLKKWSKTWPKWGMTVDGVAYAHPMWERTITAIGGGDYFATPNTLDSMPPKSHEALMKEAFVTRPGRSKPANLRDQISNMELWPTPRSCSSLAATLTPKLAAHKYPNLETIVARTMWPTLTAHNAKEGGYPAEHTRNTPTLAAKAGGKLNPTWVEWLMGWPIEWSVLKQSGTVKSPSKRRQRSKSSVKDGRDATEKGI
jgi:hypothetical protein